MYPARRPWIFSTAVIIRTLAAGPVLSKIILCEIAGLSIKIT